MSGVQEQKIKFEKWLADVFQVKNFFPEELKSNNEILKFFESINYSLLGGGKRFRPSLVFAIAEAYEKPVDEFMPLASAIEMIHTYSLIHDDLPCMDNDNERRGKPTNHILYGDAQALLAGDALLTEAFLYLGRSYKHQPALGLELINLLGEAAGIRGMIGGQVLDIMMPAMTDKKVDTQHIIKMQEMKTGALIRVSIEAAAAIALSDQAIKNDSYQMWKEFGRLLGLAFQLTDDILDYDMQKTDFRNYAGATSLTNARQVLKEVSNQALNILNQISQGGLVKTNNLIQIIQFNLDRKN